MPRIGFRIMLKTSCIHVVATTFYISDFSEFNSVFVEMFPKGPPTQATVQVAKLAFDAKVEISAVAMK